MIRSRTYIAVPPGATIKEQLEDRGISQKEFAVRMDMSEKHISRLINGDVQLTTDMSIRLETVLGVPAGFWSKLEALYREDIARAEAENSLDADVDLARCFPYSEMAKLGWVPVTRNAREKALNLRKYFEVVDLSLLGNEQINRITCRKLALSEKSDLALMAWAQEAKLKARDVQTSPVDIDGLITVMPDLRLMTTLKSRQVFPRVKSCLANYGIALVFLPHLKGASMAGASFKDGKKIVVGVETGETVDDKLWLRIFHELAHIALGHVDRPGSISDADEKTADRWACDILIVTEEFNRFTADGDYSEKSVRRFAKAQGIAPGIVVERLQSEGKIKHNMLNYMKALYEVNV